MKHRILVLGAGYAGAYAAGVLARRLSPADTEITVVNAEPTFVERMRLHQLASGQQLRTLKLADAFAGTGVRLRLARVTAVDPDRATVAVTDENGDDELPYDTLLYALGSSVADHGVPGVAEHGFDVTSRASALRLRDRIDSIDSLGAGTGTGTLLVVGEGLTGIESAAEFAESRPGLSVALASRGELGAQLSPRARRHLRQTFERLGVTVHEHATIAAVEPTRVITADGTAIPSLATVWAAGFAVHPIAAASGLEVAENGQIVVDDAMRSVSHPNVHAIGDSVRAIDENNGRPLPMSCATAGVTGMRAVDAIVAELTGHRGSSRKLNYVGNHISLGRRDAIIQMVDGEARPKSWFLGGRPAARVKAGVLRGALWSISHPTFGMPKRRRPANAAATSTAHTTAHTAANAAGKVGERLTA
ncbi:NAD(P)/FAD-dependent oxidoreductase [Streptomyces sp. 4N509B]|uniref:NAD(P)/FAD-dependent oxidoreductase n=1 Tax=Streptomyces sp. 4N509B TaxID=3457413 RepID=UPI003FD64F00